MEFTSWDSVLSNALAHHGIKEQKWGQRRFQNEDGSLTAAGRLRYEQAGHKMSRRARKAAKASKLVKKANKKSTAKNVVKKVIAAKWAYNKTKSSDIPKGKKIIKALLLYGIGKRVLRTKVTHR